MLGSEVLCSIFGSHRRQEEGTEYMSFILSKITLNRCTAEVKVAEFRGS
jgi:hypothetical protein